MTDKNSNVVLLFGGNDGKQSETLVVQEEVCDRVSNVQEVRDLPLHESFTRDNVIGALASNTYISFGQQAIEEFLSNPEKHDFDEMMQDLYKYIKNGLDIYMQQYGAEIQWGGTTLNSFFIIEKGKKNILAEFTVELDVNENMDTAILIKDGTGIVTAMIHNHELAVG